MRMTDVRMENLKLILETMCRVKPGTKVLVYSDDYARSVTLSTDIMELANAMGAEAVMTVFKTPSLFSVLARGICLSRYSSLATMRPVLFINCAVWAVFPPGEAHMSRTKESGAGERTRGTRHEVKAWGWT